jgi:hypothetical protein
MESNMNLDKSQKRINKRVKRGFHGYPMISIQYFGPTEVLETFNSETDIRQDETVQTTIIKIIDRVDAKTVTLDDKVKQLS